MRHHLAALHVALFFSGAAGLVYESSWTRLLHRVFGVGDLAVATVLATFFLGLGLGNGLAARYAAKVVRPARAYAILEVGVGLYALLSLLIVPGLGAAYGAVGADASFATLTLVRFVLACLALLPPTILMGATLPIVAEASTDPAWSRSVTAFYTSNTLGAVVGAGLAGFFLVPHFGTRATVVVGAVLSFAAAAIVLAALRDARKEARPSAPLDDAEASASDVASSHRTPLGLAAVLTFLAGAAALGSEVIWTRVLRIVVHGTTPAFAAMLVNYLLGIAVGALVARALTKRFHPARLLGATQMTLVVLTGLAIALVPFAPRVIPMLREMPDTVPNETWIIGLVSGALLFPLAVVLGTGLPTTWAMIDRGADAGRGSAIVLAANTVGGLVGSLAAGFLLVPSLGTEASLLAFAGVNALVAAIALRGAAPDGDEPTALLQRVGAIVGPLAVLVVVLLARPSLELRFLLSVSTDPVQAMVGGPGEAWNRRVVFLREGRNTTVTVLDRGTSLGLYNDGRPESGFSQGMPGFGQELVVLGGLPGVLAAERRDAMIIGLGAGHTASVALATGFEHVRVIELEEGIVEASRLLYEARGRPFPLDDPRAQLIIDDARNQLGLMPEGSLDAVISQPSHPWLAGSSALYTVEFFGEVRRALRPGGVFGLWVNLFRMDVPHLRSVVRTLLEVFPIVHGFVVENSSLVLMASNGPVRFGPEQTERIRSADASGPFFAPFDLGSVEALLAHLELDPEAARTFAEGGALIVDDRPLLELELAGIQNSVGLDARAIDRAVEGEAWLHAMPEGVPDPTELLLRRLDVVAARPAGLRRVESSFSDALLSGVEDEALIRGRVAELRGDVTHALEAYDRSAAVEAHDRAAALRFDEALWESLAASVGTSPPPVLSDPSPVIRAALVTPRPDARIVAFVRANERHPMARATMALIDRGCVAATEESVTSVADATPEIARFLAQCAWTSGDVEAATRHEQVAWRLRTAEAGRLTRDGEVLTEQGNGGLALLVLRRALRLYPTTTRAAIALARLHQRDGRPDQARAVILAAFEATAGLDEARGRLVQAALSLGIELPRRDADPGASASSTSTVPSAMGGVE